MEKKIALALLLLILPSVYCLVDIDKSYSSPIIAGEKFNVTIVIIPTDSHKTLDLAEVLPANWSIENWWISDYDGNVSFSHQDKYLFDKPRRIYDWHFSDTLLNKITLTYQITAMEPGIYESITIWVYPSGFSSKTYTFTVIPGFGIPFCGNGICEETENSYICPQDCPRKKIKVQVNITIIIIAIILSLLFYFAYKKNIEIRAKKKEKVALHDLALMLKFGLRRGYQLSEMLEALKTRGVDTYYIEKLIELENLKEIEKKLAPKPGKISPTDYLILRMEKVISRLEREEVGGLYKKLRGEEK